MTGAAADSGDTFDVQRVRELVELMQEFDLSAIDLKQGGQRIRLRRGTAPAILANTSGLPSETTGTVRPQPAGSELPRPVEAASETSLTVIKSPMVGTFYTSPSPDASPFVKVGDHVGPDTTVCIIEAMKVFNDIPAGVAGKVISVLVENGDPVEFGQALFRVDPNP